MIVPSVVYLRGLQVSGAARSCRKSPTLRADAERVRGLIGTLPPGELIEQVTNGIAIEPGPGTWRVELTPQHHLRPYNNDSALVDGIHILYPADVLPTSADAPPMALLRLTRGLSDESRLRILRFLSLGPSSLTEVARYAGLSQPTVHHHLSKLRSAGLVRIHNSLASTARYSLRTHALAQLSDALGTYLEPGGSCWACCHHSIRISASPGTRRTCCAKPNPTDSPERCRASHGSIGRCANE